MKKKNENEKMKMKKEKKEYEIISKILTLFTQKFISIHFNSFYYFAFVHWSN